MNMIMFTNGQPDKGWKEMSTATYYGSKNEIRVDDFGCELDDFQFLAVCNPLVLNN